MNQLGTALLETERLILRRIKENDCTAMFHSWASREECSEFLPWSPAKDREAYKARVLTWIENYENPLYFQWVIERKATQEVIGIINLHNVDEVCQSAETSYILSPEYWGKGVMTEALKRVLEFAFESLELNYVQADVFAGNTASEKVLKKCGMRLEGIEKDKYCKDGKYFDSVQYGIGKGAKH